MLEMLCWKFGGRIDWDYLLLIACCDAVAPYHAYGSEVL